MCRYAASQLLSCSCHPLSNTCIRIAYSSTSPSCKTLCHSDISVLTMHLFPYDIAIAWLQSISAMRAMSLLWLNLQCQRPVALKKLTTQETPSISRQLCSLGRIELSDWKDTLHVYFPARKNCINSLKIIQRLISFARCRMRLCHMFIREMDVHS